MTDQEIIIAVAKLDGYEHVNILNEVPNEWAFAKYHDTFIEEAGFDDFEYLTSRDAIIPVIEKQPSNVRLAVYKNLKKHLFNKTNEYEALIIDVCFQEPKQLCIALLKATGEWKE